MASSSRYDNALLAALPPDEMTRLAAGLEWIDLPLKMVLHEAEEPLTHVWFLRTGVCSLVTAMEDRTIVELATTGHEGFVGVNAVMASRQTTQKAFMQVPGDGYRLPIALFEQALDELPSLGPRLLRFALALMAQIAQGAACNRLHPIEARCARWLLMTHDRVEGDSFQLTQEFLGQMLGASRPSVSIAAGMLQKAGYIHYVRGVIDILDRAGLEGASCECYAIITRKFHRLLSS